MGRIGKEVAVRANAFGMQAIGYDLYWDEDFGTKHRVERCQEIQDLFARVDYLSLHTNLTPETRELVRAETIKFLKPDAIVLNCARGEIVHTADVAEALGSGALRGYGTDVLDEEPPPADHPLTHLPNCLVTPHIGSRTRESVQRQAVAAVTNLINAMRGEPPLAQVNPEVAIQRSIE
jgi:D-3-phosphoglycerate dehydrogenase